VEDERTFGGLHLSQSLAILPEAKGRPDEESKPFALASRRPMLLIATQFRFCPDL